MPDWITSTLVSVQGLIGSGLSIIKDNDITAIPVVTTLVLGGVSAVMYCVRKARGH